MTKDRKKASVRVDFDQRTDNLSDMILEDIPMTTVLYARVSTVDQTIAHQEAQARAAGFAIDRVVADHGVSGVRVPLSERPEGRRLFDLLRAGDTLVVRWVDRLGRDYRDVTDTIREFMRRGVIVRTVINGLTFDGATKDPMQQAVRDALIAFMAATAQAQAEATKEAQAAGISHAKGAGDHRYLGRKPSFTREQIEAVSAALARGDRPSTIAKAFDLSRQTIYRIKDDAAAAYAAVEAWQNAASDRTAKRSEAPEGPLAIPGFAPVIAKPRSAPVEFRGRMMSLTEAVAAAGNVVDVNHARSRIRGGMSVERAVTEPTRGRV